jgi:WD40 repeat protein
MSHFDNKLRYSIWDARSGALVRRFGAFRGYVEEFDLSPSGKLFAAATGEWAGNYVVLFNGPTGGELLRIKKPAKGMRGLALNDEALALPTDDFILLYNVTTGKPIGKLQRRVSDFYPQNPRFSPDGSQLLWIGQASRNYESYANGNSNDEIVWFNYKKRRRISAIELPRTQVYTARFSGDGKVILAVGASYRWVKGFATNNDIHSDFTLFAVDVKTGSLRYSQPLPSVLTDFAVSPNGRWFGVLFEEGTFGTTRNLVSIREVKTGREIQRIGGDGPLYAWSADSKTFYRRNGYLEGQYAVARWQLQANGKWTLKQEKSARN